MDIELTRRVRWALTIGGALAVVFGAAAVVWPALGLTALVAVFAAFALVALAYAAIELVALVPAASRWRADRRRKAERRDVRVTMAPDAEESRLPADRR